MFMRRYHGGDTPPPCIKECIQVVQKHVLSLAPRGPLLSWSLVPAKPMSSDPCVSPGLNAEASNRDLPLWSMELSFSPPSSFS